MNSITNNSKVTSTLGVIEEAELASRELATGGGFVHGAARAFSVTGANSALVTPIDNLTTAHIYKGTASGPSEAPKQKGVDKVKALYRGVGAATAGRFTGNIALFGLLPAIHITSEKALPSEVAKPTALVLGGFAQSLLTYPYNKIQTALWLDKDLKGGVSYAKELFQKQGTKGFFDGRVIAVYGLRNGIFSLAFVSAHEQLQELVGKDFNKEPSFATRLVTSLGIGAVVNTPISFFTGFPHVVATIMQKEVIQGKNPTVKGVVEEIWKSRGIKGFCLPPSLLVSRALASGAATAGGLTLVQEAISIVSQKRGPSAVEKSEPSKPSMSLEEVTEVFSSGGSN